MNERPDERMNERSKRRTRAAVAHSHAEVLFGLRGEVVVEQLHLPPHLFRVVPVQVVQPHHERDEQHDEDHRELQYVLQREKCFI